MIGEKGVIPSIFSLQSKDNMFVENTGVIPS
jgi:hypothetical protein